MELKWQRLEGRDGHTAGRQLLAEMAGQREIQYTDRGKPYFADGGPHFSISHTKAHIFCCVSQRNVGIDAEEMDRKIDPRLAQRYLSEKEKNAVEESGDPNTALLRLWVLKEAWVKLTGKGIGNFMKNTDFHPDDPRIQIIDGCFIAVLEE